MEKLGRKRKEIVIEEEGREREAGERCFGS